MPLANDEVKYRAMVEDSRTLITNAFDKARESGRLDWHRMSVAVLKNRLLDLTDRTFREADYGVSTFREFVTQHDDVLELDESTTPAVATLKGAASERQTDPRSQLSRIRSDLWWAVLDFSSHQKYFWDPAERVARPGSPENALGPEMPTITADTFTKWKMEFAEGVDNAERDDRLEEWTSSRRPATFLDPPLRHRWNGFLKKKARDRLLAWFGQQKLDPPRDLMEVQERSGSETRGEDLRRRLITCLRSMSTEELERVQIPASALLRLRP